MSANAIERLRGYVNEVFLPDGDVDATWTNEYQAALDDLAAVEALLEAAKEFVLIGHSYRCPRRLLDGPCSCGRDALYAAVRRVESGQ